MSSSEVASTKRRREKPLVKQHDLEEQDSDAIWHFHVLLPSLRRFEQNKRGADPVDCVLPQPRAEVVDWIARQHEDFGLSQATLFLAVRIIDRFLETKAVKPVTYPLVGAVSLLVASKFEDQAYPCMTDLAEAGGGHFAVGDLHPMEVELLECLEYRLHGPTAFHHMYWLQELNNASYAQVLMGEYIAELGLRNREVRRWSPLAHAASAVVLSNLLLGRQAWTIALREFCVTTVDASGQAEIRDQIETIVQALHSELIADGPGSALYDKHSSERRGYAALAARGLVQASSDVVVPLRLP